MLLKSYYHLTKPGIIYGNAVTAAAGFFLAARWHIHPLLLVWMLIGLSLIIASGCVFNNYLDRDIDAKMARTKNRALVTHAIPNRNAIIFGIALGILGIIVLFLYTNVLTLALALVGAIVYIAFYTPLKTRSEYSTIVGSIAGAVPPVVGYTAITHRLDLGSILLFLILVLWQMPHFYAIATYRKNDYAAAGTPVLTVKRGIKTAKIHIVLYILAFTVITALLTVYGYTGYIYLIIMLLLCLLWLTYGLIGFRKNNNDEKWARKMFFFSLIIIMAFYVLVAVDVK